jgi:hypothetical protein
MPADDAVALLVVDHGACCATAEVRGMAVAVLMGDDDG